jgi:hypothetical protein
MNWSVGKMYKKQIYKAEYVLATFHIFLKKELIMQRMPAKINSKEIFRTAQEFYFGSSRGRVTTVSKCLSRKCCSKTN